MAITSHDVARLAGVSQATVSRALRGDPRISQTTRDRVVEAARTLRYTPSEAGRVLRTNSTRQVAMVADLMNQLYPTLVPAIHDTLAEQDYRLVVLAEPEEELSVLDRLLDRSVDGVVLTTIFLNASLPVELRRHGIPFVYLNRINDVVSSDSVTADNAAGAEAAGDLLVRLGHERIAAIFGPREVSTGRDRERGFRRALEKGGVLLAAERVRRTWFAFDYGRAAAAELIDADPRPTALFCANDLLAAGALAELHERGLRVPEDVSVVGFDDLELASWPWLSLTTVASPLSEMAERATRLLLERIEQGAEGDWRQEVFQVHLVLRGTHGPPTS